MTAVLLMSVLARGSVLAAQAPSCPTSCVDQGIVYTREKAGATSTVSAGTQASADSTLSTTDISVPKPAQIEDLGAAGQTVPDFSFSERFTAQRKPRVTVLAFENANAAARPPIFSESVEAMLVTFLKRKSQFTVVERERMGDILEEWKLGRDGRTNMRPSEARELLESVDSIIMGSVTVLDAPNDVKLATTPPDNQAPPPGGYRAEWGWGTRVEVDLKALGRSDGRIIAAAKSSGPIHCLRSIVERLGVALEEGFLRPYYGTLQFALSSPDNVRIYLTPILSNKARDDEKPPVERGESLIRGTGQDFVEPWTTNPTSYKVHNVLGGWYTMRLERPGYEQMGIINGNEEFQVHELGGRSRVFYQQRDEISGAPVGEPVPLAQAPTNLSKFVVYVDSRETRVFDGDKLRLSPAKLGGSLAPLIRRQLLDRQFAHTPQRVVLIGKSGLDINRLDRPKEYGDDQTCDLFVERSPSKISYGRTHIAIDETFDFDSFRGGDLIIENYQGEVLPAGQYQIAYWEPGYDVLQGIARVNQGDKDRPTHASLVRKTLPLDLSTMGPRHPYRVRLVGKTTGYEAEIPLNFMALQERLSLPVDDYTVSSKIPGLGKWNSYLSLQPDTDVAPTFDPIEDERMQREKEKEEKKKAEWEKEERKKNSNWVAPPENETDKLEAELQAPMPLKFIERYVFGDVEPPVRKSLRVKTRIGVGGRLSAFGSTSHFDSDEFYLDHDLAKLLDRVFGLGELEREEIEKAEEEAQKKPGAGKAKALQWASLLSNMAGNGAFNSFLGPEAQRWGITAARATSALQRGQASPNQGVISQWAPFVEAMAGSNVLGRAVGPENAQYLAMLQNIAGAYQPPPTLPWWYYSNTPVAAPTTVPPPAEEKKEEDEKKSAGDEEKEPKEPAFMKVKNPTLLRDMLAQRLETIDLLVLDDEDMKRIRENPEVASILRRYVAAGGALYAFVGEEGDYGSIVGSPLYLKAVGKSNRFEMTPGDVATVRFAVEKKKESASLRSGRPVLQPEQGLGGDWRVLGYAEGRKGPRVFERGDMAQGGYVAIWLDQPALFRSRVMGDRIPQVEAARAEVEKRVVRWARYLASRRYDETGEELRKARQALEAPTAQAPTMTAENNSPSAPAATSAVRTASSGTLAESLKQIEELKKQGLLTQEEYERKRSEILSRL